MTGPRVWLGLGLGGAGSEGYNLAKLGGSVLRPYMFVADSTEDSFDMAQQICFELRDLCAVVAAVLLMWGPASVNALSATSATAIVFARPVAVPAVDPACKPVFDANDKTLDTPNHAYMEQTEAGGKKVASELVTINGQRYLMMNGKWSKSLMTVAATKAQEEENKKNAKVVSCKRVGSDSVNGQAATVYTQHSETEDSKADGKVWISNSGVNLKTEIDLDSGDPATVHISIRYEYGNVKAPI